VCAEFKYFVCHLPPARVPVRLEVSLVFFQIVVCLLPSFSFEYFLFFVIVLGGVLQISVEVCCPSNVLVASQWVNRNTLETANLDFYFFLLFLCNCVCILGVSVLWVLRLVVILILIAGAEALGQSSIRPLRVVVGSSQSAVLDWIAMCVHCCGTQGVESYIEAWCALRGVCH